LVPAAALHWVARVSFASLDLLGRAAAADNTRYEPLNNRTGLGLPKAHRVAVIWTGMPCRKLWGLKHDFSSQIFSNNKEMLIEPWVKHGSSVDLFGYFDNRTGEGLKPGLKRSR
jgi:hypothetical protein